MYTSRPSSRTPWPGCDSTVREWIRPGWWRQLCARSWVAGCRAACGPAVHWQPRWPKWPRRLRVPICVGSGRQGARAAHSCSANRAVRAGFAQPGSGPVRRRWGERIGGIRRVRLSHGQLDLEGARLAWRALAADGDATIDFAGVPGRSQVSARASLAVGRDFYPPGRAGVACVFRLELGEPWRSCHPLDLHSSPVLMVGRQRLALPARLALTWGEASGLALAPASSPVAEVRSSLPVAWTETSGSRWMSCSRTMP